MAYKALDRIAVCDIEAVGIPKEEAVKLHFILCEILCSYGTNNPETWKNISKLLLRPDLPFALHQMMYYGCFKGTDLDTPPAWIPDPENVNSTNIGQLLEKHGRMILGLRYRDPLSSFADFQEYSALNPEVYWRLIFDEMKISFSAPPLCILHEHATEEGRQLYPGGQWLPGAVMNAAENCLNLNGKRSLDDIMVIWRDEGDDDLPLQRMTLEELRAKVCQLANALDTLGLEKGSAIAIDMPMNVTSVIVYLAIILAGYVVVSIADSFAPSEISLRLKISKAKVIFTQDFIVRGGKSLPLYRRVKDAGAPMAVVVSSNSNSELYTELRDCDVTWNSFLERGKHFNCRASDYSAVDQPIEAPTNILFSSGTTGEPKAIPWSHATPLKAAADAWSHMDIRKGDVVCWPTNLGWMMGPWLVYAALLNGASMALYNGSPLGSGFAKFVQDANVTMLGVVPSIVRSWKNTDCTAGLDWSNVRCFSSTGEASSVDEYLWLMGRAKYKPVIEYCGGTEIGGGFVTGSMLQSQSLAAFSTPAMGCTLFILGTDGMPLPQTAAATGELALHPCMLGASTTLLNANHYDVYFKDMPVWKGKVLRRHGDEFERTSHGYYRAHGRADDTMNLGGIKVSSIEIERTCNGADDNVLETAAIGVPPAGGGPEKLFIAVVFKNTGGCDLEKLKMTFNSSIQTKLNPLFKVHHVAVVPSLPRTASNKVMRRILRQQFIQLDQIPKL